LQFPYTDEHNDIPSGSFLVAGDCCLNELKDRHGIDFMSIAACKKCFTDGKQSSWVFVFNEILKKPFKMCEEMTFDDLHR
jgi:hypothetical protein